MSNSTLYVRCPIAGAVTAATGQRASHLHFYSSVKVPFLRLCLPWIFFAFMCPSEVDAAPDLKPSSCRSLCGQHNYHPFLDLVTPLNS